MNYPIWDVPSPGLLIALVAIVHVFVSHFAVGGGLFLVWTERKARRDGDAELLGYVRKHSRFFVLLTLVFGAITGVGIWFTIGLVHPAATSSLINTWVWGWAIEWVFFLVEIVAAMVYYYGWDRLSARDHMIVGWIYFWCAWASLVVINGILTYMLTPGEWLTERTFFSGFLNETYWPALLTRTLASIGLAGIYALLTSAWVNDDAFGRRVARYATIGWIVPMAIGLPIGLLWFFSAADAAGVPTAEVLGASGPAMTDFLRTLTKPPGATGYPTAQMAFRVAFFACAAVIVVALAGLAITRAAGRRIVATILMIASFAAVGGAEWFREDLRKPWVIGSYMFVNAARVPDTTGKGDAYAIDRLREGGVLAASKWARLPDGIDLTNLKSIDEEAAVGREVFRVACTQCHTVDGYLAIRPLVSGWNTSALEAVIDNLAAPTDKEKGWGAHPLKLDTWRGRRMPPFPGNEIEEHALAVYLAQLGGGAIVPRAAGANDGAALFEANCSACHGEGGDFPIEPLLAGKTRDQLHESLGRLPEINEMMPPFEGSDTERDALAAYLAGIAAGGKR